MPQTPGRGRTSLSPEGPPLLVLLDTSASQPKVLPGNPVHMTPFPWAGSSSLDVDTNPSWAIEELLSQIGDFKEQRIKD